MSVDEFSCPAALVELIQHLAAAASAYYEWVVFVFHELILARCDENSKTRLAAYWKGGEAQNARRLDRNRRRQDAIAFSPWAMASVGK